MDPVVLYAWYRYVHKRRKARRWSVHPINCSRYVDGAFRNLYGMLREDEDKFFNYTRLSTRSFDELVALFQETIKTKEDIVQGLSFSPQEMLFVTLR